MSGSLLSDQSLFSSPMNTSCRRESHYKYDRWTIIFFIIGLINILSAIWMLIAPKHWYYNLPAYVPESGPLNIHFIRDIGCIFLLLGCGLWIGGFFLIEFRLPLFTMNTSFYILHMFVHIHEIVSGRLRLGIFWTDLPGVYFPAILTFALNIILIRKYMVLSKSKTRQPIRTEN
ncbi:unnamed protein product [Adineta steineri]|uniref:Uncharacterized protein n=1 Tax=Adineta steineri TaxID=433720 RepID=A0A815GBF5_9BILA|nr:unnamed protein product [Adineta steineri]CAF1336356.1 unnamed protein product [Adineta steineri]CAF1440674.1 unnamed protein product [Adineta steineri]